MSSITQDKVALEAKAKRPLQLTRERLMEIGGLSAILLLAAWLHFANLDSLGYVNHYYTAGVKSMLQSWHNFFFVAAEPGGSVTIDKPPVGLWLQAISAYFLGVNGFSVLLPEILAGIASAAVLHHLIRRSFGIMPGLLAAFTLAFTPIVVATDRNNTIDSTLILTLLLATWAFIKATETRKLRFLLLGALLVGIGFNIKMLQAYLPLPAFYTLYFLGSSETVGRKLGKLALATALLLTNSLSWAVIVDLTPADQRPYVGSSSDNSELDLIVGYNGVNRLLGMFGRGHNNQQPGIPRSQDLQPGGPPLFAQNGNNAPSMGPGGNRPQFGSTAGGNGPAGGGLNIGQAGPFRLFISPLNKEISWLLPFGLFTIILVAFTSRWSWPLAWKHQALVLWGLWLITCVVFFSIAGFFHEYYLSMLGAPLAALVAIGISEFWSLSREKTWISIGMLYLAALGTITLQFITAHNFMSNVWWTPIVVAIIAIALIVLAISAFKQNIAIRSTGFALTALAMLFTPGIWSVYTVMSANQNQALPSSYSGGEVGPVAQRDLQINRTMLGYLQENTSDITYLIAVPSAMQGADYVLATGRPVLYIGGFNGQDHVVTAEDLAQLVSSGELRYIYWNTNSGMGSNSDISAWVTSACTPIDGFSTTPQNFGVPDGTTPDMNNTPQQNAGEPQVNMQVSLFDCKKSN